MGSAPTGWLTGGIRVESDRAIDGPAPAIRGDGAGPVIAARAAPET